MRSRASDQAGRNGVAAGGHAYRPDIDGLRALAVLPILLSHVGARGFAGGYVGVDIFFVISGYLITGILVRDCAAQRHTIANFYRRRILRIFPALAVVLAATTAVTLVAMLPGELVRYGHSLAATAAFGSNILFYFENGYFDAVSRTKPLLHSWSLAVEEQFYILWPLLVAACAARGPRAIRWAIGVVTVVSFLLAAWLVRIDMAAAFYMLPARAWELGIGGLLAVLPVRVARGWLREAIGAAALLVLALCCWKYGPLTPFPGLGALPPCLAAAALIVIGAESRVGRLLSIWPARFVGQISYSLYLWHWPVVVFAEVWLLRSPTAAMMAAEVALSLVLAILSWRFVERPFRDRGRAWSTPAILTAGGVTIVLFAAAGLALAAADGLPGRFTPAQAAVAAYQDRDYEAGFRRGSCFVVAALDSFDPGCIRPAAATDPRPALLLVGDSMAADLWPGFSRHRDRFDILQATMVGCTPGVYTADTSARCARFFRATLSNWQPPARPYAILLSGIWRDFDMPVLDETLAALQRRGLTVILLGPMPNYDAALPRLLVMQDRRHDPDLAMRAQSRDVFETDRTMATLAARHNATYISMVSLLCRGERCRTWAAPGVPLQFDRSHLTPAGSALVVDGILPAIAARLGQR